MSEPLIDIRPDSERRESNRQPLRRDEDHRMVAGVCAGLGGHLDLDPTLVRAAFIGSLVFGGFGAALYLALWVLLDRPEISSTSESGPSPHPHASGQGDFEPSAWA